MQEGIAFSAPDAADNYGSTDAATYASDASTGHTAGHAASDDVWRQGSAYGKGRLP